MRFSFTLIVTSLLATTISAQGQNSTAFPEGFDPTKVELDERSSWCTGETNTCRKVCGSAKENRCSPGDLTYSCVCQDGTEPDLTQYINSLPFFICQANFGQCIENNPDDAQAHKKCKAAREECGDKKVEKEEKSTSSKASAASTSATATASETEAATTTGSAAEATTTTADSGAAILEFREYSFGILLAGFLGIFGFLV